MAEYIVGNSGGPGILAADACENVGLEVPELAGATQEALRGFLSPGAAGDKPVVANFLATERPPEAARLRVARDQSFRILPLTDTDALEDLLLRAGRLGDDLPELAELDLNPVIVPGRRDSGGWKLRLAPPPARPDPSLRRLR